MNARSLVLIVDHESEVLHSLKPVFEANNYGTLRAGTIAEGLKRIATDVPDLVLLDPVLPDGDGKEIIKQARQWSDVPIIVVSADERESEKIEAFDLGADDYVGKPFAVGELLARMRTALRHRAQRKAEIPVLRVHNLEVDSEDRQASRSGVQLRLTPKEFDLLSFLAKHAGRVLTHKQILTALWGPGHTEDTQYLRVYINQLRRKVEDRPDDPRFILTEPGIGYRMAAI
jgi:two-component system, OmpR family, KDP operon response regulator KdpE